MDIETRFRVPFRAVISGPSMAGKSVFCLKLVENLDAMVTEKIDKIIFCYSEWQPSYSRLPSGVVLNEGPPNLDELKSDKSSKLVVLDDLMDVISKTPALTTLFVKGSHHWNLSIIFLVQNLFYSNLRNARINTSYMVLFKNPADQLTIATLGRQLYPKRTQFFTQAFQDATSKPYGYLLVDLTQTTDDRHRLRTDIFPGEVTIVYLQR